MIQADIDKFFGIANLVQQAINEGLLEAGGMIHDLAQQLAPEETGSLKDSGDVSMVGDNIVEISFGNGLSDERAVWQELGSYNNPAQPYLYPAVKQIDPSQVVADKLKEKGL